MLLPEYRGEQNAGNGANLLVAVPVVIDAGGGAAFTAFGEGVGDVRPPKKSARGLDDWCMMIPLNPKGLLRDSPKK